MRQNIYQQEISNCRTMLLHAIAGDRKTSFGSELFSTIPLKAFNFFNCVAFDDITPPKHTALLCTGILVLCFQMPSVE